MADLAQSFEANRTATDVAANRENPNKVRLFDRCLAIGEANLQAAVRNQVIADRRLLLEFLRAYPSRASILAGLAQQVRRLWSEDLFSGGSDDISVLASLLRNNLISVNEREECLITVIRRGISGAPNAVDEATLAESGFYQHLEHVAVGEGLINRFAWGNSSSGILEHHLSRSPITADMAEAIYLTFDSVHNPRDLRQRLNTFFTVNAAKRTEFRNLEQANALIGLPQHLPALQNP